LNSSTV